MIVLDTNVISALMRSESDSRVQDWLDRQPATSVWITSIGVFEVRFGIHILDPGRRRDYLDGSFDRVLDEVLVGRVLDFDTAAATVSAELSASLRAQGIGVEWKDLQIAGIVASRRGTLATRNVRHFQHAGISLVNPWDHPVD